MSVKYRNKIDSLFICKTEINVLKIILKSSAMETAMYFIFLHLTTSRGEH
jgi:hypothetical protein